MRFRWKHKTFILFLICSDTSPATKILHKYKNKHINRKNRFTSRLKHLYSEWTITTVSTASKSISPRSTMYYFKSDLAILGLESFVVFQENKKRREPQGRRGPMQRRHKARQQEADKERVAGKAGRSSQPTRSPPRKDKTLPDNQPHTDGCGLTSGSGHLPPMVTPASSTHTAAGRSSGLRRWEMVLTGTGRDVCWSNSHATGIEKWE